MALIGTISGSFTSTGSFGTVYIAGEMTASNPIEDNNSLLKISRLETKSLKIDQNLDGEGELLFDDKSDGRPNKMVSFSNPGFISNEIEFKEHTWSIDNLPKFMSYRIKIILASTNQVYVPRIKDLRVITLA